MTKRIPTPYEALMLAIGVCLWLFIDWPRRALERRGT